MSRYKTQDYLWCVVAPIYTLWPSIRHKLFPSTVIRSDDAGSMERGL
jgi:hypothetical protein